MGKILEQLQGANDTVKRRVLVVGTILIMAVVIVVWLKYFRVLVQPIVSVPDSAPEAHGFSLWETTKNSVAILFHAVGGLVQFIAGFLMTSKDIIIRP